MDDILLFTRVVFQPGNAAICLCTRNTTVLLHVVNSALVYNGEATKVNQI